MVKEKKGGKKAKAARRRAKAPSKPRMNGMIQMYSHGVCSITNPFCAEALNSRWPDNSYTKSVGWSAPNTQFTLTTDASGNGAAVLYCDYGTFGPAFGSLVGTTLTSGPSSIRAFGVSFPSGVVRYRITSWGFKVTASVAAMVAQGIVRVRLFSPLGGAGLATLDIANVMADNFKDLPLQRLCNEDLYVIPMPLGDNARFFRDAAAVSSTLATWVNPGWQVASVGITGGPASTAVGFVSIYANYEFVFGDGDAQTMFATPPPKDNPVVRQGNSGVLDSVGNFIEGGIDKVERVFKSKAAKYLAIGAAAYLGGPAAAAPMIADRAYAITVD